MSYIDKNLLTDEKIIFRTRKHVIIFLAPLAILLFTCFASYYMRNNYILRPFAWAPWIVVMLFWAAAGLEYYASDYAVTNKRILLREGFFYRHTTELRLSAVAQVNVDQSLLGQLLNYGSIVLNAMGAYDAFSYIDQPIVFQRYVNTELDKLVR